MPAKDIGVPGALADGVRKLGEHVAPPRVDHVWIFPPRARGRTESGVIAAACFTEGDRRLVVTLSYRATETGKGVTFETSFREEGEAPPERLPEVMRGVVERTEEALGSPRSVPIGGDEDVMIALVGELSVEVVAT